MIICSALFFYLNPVFKMGNSAILTLSPIPTNLLISCLHPLWYVSLGYKIILKGRLKGWRFLKKNMWCWNSCLPYSNRPWNQIVYKVCSLFYWCPYRSVIWHVLFHTWIYWKDKPTWIKIFNHVWALLFSSIDVASTSHLGNVQNKWAFGRKIAWQLINNEAIGIFQA